MARPSKASQHEDLVREAKEFLADRESAESEDRSAMTEDLRFAFVPGAQWRDEDRNRRVGRPCFSYNRTVGAINQLIGDMRMTQPSGKVRALNKQSATKVADVFSGLIRDIEACSGAPDIYAEAFKYQVAGAWGAWRVLPEYAGDDSFDQVLRIRRIENPQTVYLDEHADPWGRGARRGMVCTRMSVASYKAQFGDRAYASIQAARDSQGWVTNNEVRVAEYYRAAAEDKEIALLSDGRVVDWNSEMERILAELKASNVDAPTVQRRRKVKRWYITWWKVDGINVLEGPIEYDYACVPIIRSPGRYVNIEGKQYYQSLIRHSHDAQRTYNYDRSNMVETVALTPRAPWLVTTKMIQGYEQMWARANVSNSPYLAYNPDQDFPGLKPERNHGPEVPQAYIALSAHDAEDIRQTTGYFNPALDQQTAAGDAESGRALRTRLMTADSGSYEFLDNFAKAVQRTWEVCVEMIPSTYDTERIVRLLGIDGRESFERIDPEALKEARYDVTVTLGPSYATARMEALDTLLEASERIPVIGEVAPDVITENLDIRGADEISKRVRLRLIRSGVVAPNEEDQRALAEFPPPPPDPMQEQLVRQIAAQASRDEASAQKTAAEAQSAMADAQAAMRREMLDLRNLFEENRKLQAETALLLKQLQQPAESV